MNRRSVEIFTLAIALTDSGMPPSEYAPWTCIGTEISETSMRATFSTTGTRNPRPPNTTRNPTLRPSADSDIKIEVWLPTSGWNGKFQGVGNGEYPLGISLEYAGPMWAKGGAPVKVIYPSDGTFAAMEGVAIIKGGPNLESAKAFVDFVNRKDVREMILKATYRRPTRTDLDLASLPGGWLSWRRYEREEAGVRPSADADTPSGRAADDQAAAARPPSDSPDGERPARLN